VAVRIAREIAQQFETLVFRTRCGAARACRRMRLVDYHEVGGSGEKPVALRKGPNTQNPQPRAPGGSPRFSTPCGPLPDRPSPRSQAPHGTPEAWIDGVSRGAPQAFERAFDRWRELYRAACEQRDAARRIIDDPGLRDRRQKEMAEQREREVRREIELLLNRSHSTEADFYTYRYLANEASSRATISRAFRSAHWFPGPPRRMRSTARVSSG
jgi:hypothetical protein